jgi:[acyl-carrier-protein] S-malonyltransferase
VISGDLAACEAAAALAGEFECRAISLPVAGAFHSELMRSAAEGLKPVLAECAFETPRRPVVANVDASYHRDADSIRESLYRQVVNPVRWQACVERLIADGCERFWEVGPNRHLTGMMRKINRGMKTTNISTATDLVPAKA